MSEYSVIPVDIIYRFIGAEAKDEAKAVAGEKSIDFSVFKVEHHNLFIVIK